MTSFFCRLIELKATHVIWTVDTLTSQLSSSELAGGSFLRGSVLSRQYGGCDLGEGFILGVPSCRVTKGAVATWGFCPEGLMSSNRSGSAQLLDTGRVSWSVRYGHLNLLFRQAHRWQLTDKIYTVNQFIETAKPDRKKLWHTVTLDHIVNCILEYIDCCWHCILIVICNSTKCHFMIYNLQSCNECTIFQS